MIAALVPFRSHIVSRLFSEEDLVYLDPLDEAFTSPSEGDDDENIEATDETPIEGMDDSDDSAAEKRQKEIAVHSA